MHRLYRRVAQRGRLSWRFRKKTEIRAEARYGHYTYDARQVTPEDPSKRERSYWTASLTAEHALNERTAFTLHYDFRENAGNRPVDRYTTQTLYSGIRLTF